jgi:hypothetical protein
MTKYLLLRDNKESGPYSFDDLKQKGLKAYDLVWVEGRSAAWRYPCEVEELSAFAPAVEEQPFDRFYKRPGQEKASSLPTVQLKQVAGNETSAKISVSVSGLETGSGSSIFSGEPSAVPGKRIIYVTLPAGKGAPATPREPVKTPVAFQERQRTIGSPYEPVPTNKVNTADQPASIPVATDFPLSYGNSAEEKSAQAREDWNAGVEILPRTGNRSKFMQPIAVVLCVLALLAAGIFIGLSIDKYNLTATQKISRENGVTNPPPTIDPPAKNLPAPAPSAAPVLQVNALNTDTIKTAPLTGAPVTNLKKSAGAKEKSSLPAQKTPSALSSSAKDSAMTALTVSHREASHRTDQPVEKIDKDILRSNLSNLVSVGTNGYTVGTFGGISGVQLTVSNKSVYALDLVVVEVQYVQANKKVFKTENLYFRGIGPGSALMQEAPNSSRGIKVQYKITLVNSKELGLSYSAL